MATSGCRFFCHFFEIIACVFKQVAQGMHLTPRRGPKPWPRPKAGMIFRASSTTSFDELQPTTFDASVGGTHFSPRLSYTRRSLDCRKAIGTAFPAGATSRLLRPKSCDACWLTMPARDVRESEAAQMACDVHFRMSSLFPAGVT